VKLQQLRVIDPGREKDACLALPVKMRAGEIVRRCQRLGRREPGAASAAQQEVMVAALATLCNAVRIGTGQQHASQFQVGMVRWRCSHL
jgi:hypothetical protein